jgi:hypothetical protein
MLDGFLGRAMHWRVLALRLLDHFTDDRLKLEQLHLRLRKDVPRSGARPAAARPARNSVRVASAIFWRPTPPAPTGRPKKLLYSSSSSSSIASSDADSACRSSNPDSGKTRCVACHSYLGHKSISSTGAYLKVDDDAASRAIAAAAGK